MTITEIGKMTDEQAREYLENIRWPNGPVCPHCQSTNVTRMQGEAHRPGTVRRRLKDTSERRLKGYQLD